MAPRSLCQKISQMIPALDGPKHDCASVVYLRGSPLTQPAYRAQNPSSPSCFPPPRTRSCWSPDCNHKQSISETEVRSQIFLIDCEVTTCGRPSDSDCLSQSPIFVHHFVVRNPEDPREVVNRILSNEPMRTSSYEALNNPCPNRFPKTAPPTDVSTLSAINVAFPD